MVDDNPFSHLIIEHCRDVLTLVDTDGRIRFVTPGVETRFGYPVSQVLGTGFLDYVHPDDRESAAAAFERTLTRTQQHPSVVLRLLHRSGESRFVELTGTYLDTPEFHGALLNARDVTEHQQQINDLLHSEEAFQAAFNATSTLSAISVPETGEHLNVNDAWLETLGWTRDEVIGRTALELNVWGSPENRARVLDALREQGSLRQFRAALYTRHGEPRNVLVDAKYLELASGTVAYFSSIDVTERDQFEEQLRQAQKMDAIGQLTGGIAHDFNNILNVIIGNAELAGIQRQQGSDPGPALGAILDAANGAARLIQQLLSFSRKQTLAPASFNVGERLEHTRSLLITSLGKDIRLAVEPGDGGWLCHLDPGLFDSAVLNLVLNARDAMPRGGSLTLRTSRATIPQGADWQGDPIAPGDYVRFEIRDTGHGIPQAALTKVFEPFFTTKAEGLGTGLGLSMVFGFVKQSGGYITIESDDSGTAVTLLLPRSRTRPAEAHMPAHRSTVDHQGRRVLLVEDNEGIRRLISSMLRSLHMEVVEAASGDEALALLDQPLDLLITDVMLPGSLKGPDVARHLQERSPSIPVLFVSGHDRGLLNDYPFSDHGIGFLPKPFKRAELADKVDALLATV